MGHLAGIVIKESLRLLNGNGGDEGRYIILILGENIKSLIKNIQLCCRTTNRQTI